MTLALACASHSPLMRDGYAPEATRKVVAKGFSALAGEMRDFAPDLAIQFAPDHFNGFFYDLMPPYCVGVAAESIGDWGTRAGPLAVPEALATDLARHLLQSGLDTAVSYRMQVDHGFVQIWEHTLGDAGHIPLIPIFINCAAPPMPTLRRIRELGEAVGHHAAGLGKRVLIVASGGLSHDPPTPQIAGATTELRERLIANRNPTAEARAQREARVLAAGHGAANGDEDILPVSPEWDHDFLRRLMGNDPHAFDEMPISEVVEKAGRGGPEILCWVAAMAAMRAAGPIETTLHLYEAVQGWIAGMAILSGREASA